MSQSEFKVGDIVIISHTSSDNPLCVLGKILAIGSRHYSQAIFIDTLLKYDPKGVDDTNPGEWPTNAPEALRIERCGPPEADVPV